MLSNFRQLWFSAGGHLLCQDGKPDHPAYLASRPYLESQVRRRVRALPNVITQDGCRVARLITTPGRDRVTGARVLPRGGDAEEIPADLVVDATGRGARTPAWLSQIGYDPPAEEQVRVDLMYATRHPRLSPGALG
jgi:2-polyprenyl-6-methoxyphenol hydroxylase-like FAD-dependent oxidoreductase